MDMISLPRTAYIYALLDPDTDEIRYIGWTKQPPIRFSGHISDAKRRCKSHCNRWVATLLECGKLPVMQIIEETDTDHFAERECYWIDYHRSIGTRLTNTADGGSGAPGVHLSDEHKKRLSEIAKASGRKPPNTPEVRAKISATNTGRKDSVDVRKRKSEARKGIPLTDKHKQHLRDSRSLMLASEKGQQLKETISRAYGKLTDAQVIEVWRLAHEGVLSQRIIAERYGIPASTVSQIKNGKRYKYVKRPQS